MFFKNAVILIFFILLNAIQTESLSFPIYSTKNLSNCTTTEEILDYFKNNKIYSFIQIGKPPKQMPIIFTSHDSISIIKKDDCPITSEYDINFSKSINILYDELNKRYFYIKDYISFDDKNKSILMNFIHYNQTDIKEGNCGFIGIQNIEPEEKFTKQQTTKEWLIEKEKAKINNHAKKHDETEFSIQPLVSACVNHPGFKYKLSEVKEMNIFEFYDSVKRLQIYENATACLRGLFSGFVDGSKINPDQYNFMKEI